MQCCRTSSAAVVFLAAVLAADAELSVGPGMPRTEVVAELGAPHSTFAVGDREVLHYENGSVTLVSNVVVEADLLTPEEAEARSRRRAEQEAARREQLEAEHRERLAAGLRLRDRALEDPVLATASAERRVAFWRDFARRYPEIPLGDQYDRALQEWQADRLASLTPPAAGTAPAAVARVEERVARAEERIAEAEARALHIWERALEQESERLAQERADLREERSEEAAGINAVIPLGYVTVARRHRPIHEQPALPTTVKYPGRLLTPGPVLGFSHLDPDVPNRRGAPLSEYPRISYD